MFVQTLLNSLWLILMVIVFAVLVFNGLVKLKLVNLLFKKTKKNKNKEKGVHQE